MKEVVFFLTHNDPKSETLFISIWNIHQYRQREIVQTNLNLGLKLFFLSNQPHHVPK